MMTPVRKRVLPRPAAQPPCTRAARYRSAGLPVGTAGAGAGVEISPGPAQPRHQMPGGIRVRSGAAGASGGDASQLRRLVRPSTACRTPFEVLVQSSRRDTGRQSLLVEAGGQSGAGSRAEHAPILTDPDDERRGEDRHA